MKNNIDALNDVLFNTLQELQENKIEIPKAKAIIDVAGAIAKNASLQMQAFKLTKGKTPAPKTLITGKVFATIGNGDVHAQKVEFAQSIGYDSLDKAFAAIGTYAFNKKFDKAFDR